MLFAVVVVKHLAAPDKHTVYPLYAKAARELMAGGPTAALISHQHLPYFAGVLAAPFAALPDRYGGALWGVASLAVLVTGLRAFADRFAPGDRRAAAAVLLVAPLAGLGSLANNQSNLVITGCLCWGAALVRDRRWWAAALVLAVPGFKIYPLALGLVYAALYPRAFALRFAGAVAAWNLLPFVFHPAALIQERFAYIGVYIGSGVHYEEYGIVGVREFLARYGAAIGPGAYFPVQAAAGAVIVLALLLARRTGADERAVDERAAVLTGLWFVTFGPSVEPPTYLLAGPGLGLLVAAGLRGELTRAGRALVVAAVALCGPLQTDLLGPAARRAVTGAKLSCPAVTLVLAYRLAAARRGSGIGGQAPMILTGPRLGRLPTHPA